jgi:hypothetical protein
MLQMVLFIFDFFDGRNVYIKYYLHVNYPYIDYCFGLLIMKAFIMCVLTCSLPAERKFPTSVTILESSG